MMMSTGPGHVSYGDHLAHGGARLSGTAGLEVARGTGAGFMILTPTTCPGGQVCGTGTLPATTCSGHNPRQLTPSPPPPPPSTPVANSISPGRRTRITATNKYYVDIMAASTASTVAIDNKIEQAMDLVKSHLMFAVREEVEVLKEKITELMERINQLEYENTVLKQYATNEALQQSQQHHNSNT